MQHVMPQQNAICPNDARSVRLTATSAPPARPGSPAATARDVIERDRAALVRFARRLATSREDAEDAVNRPT